MRITFAAKNQPRNYFRLAFSSIADEKIEPGVRLLAETAKTLK
jgi:GntR family transcriptional regulator / MocR family aminotransferase